MSQKEVLAPQKTQEVQIHKSEIKKIDQKIAQEQEFISSRVIFRFLPRLNKLTKSVKSINLKTN